MKGVNEWLRVLRDVTIVLVGAFMLLYETIASMEPNYLIVGAGLTLLGVPPVLRLDVKRKREDDA